MKHFIIWLLAEFTDSQLWRVLYPNGSVSSMMDFCQAYRDQELHGGRMLIDYNVKLSHWK